MKLLPIKPSYCLLVLFSAFADSSFAQGADGEPQVVVVAPKTELMEGDLYSAEVFLAMPLAEPKMEVTINGVKWNVANGRAIYQQVANPEKQKWSGTVRVPQPGGKMKEYKIPEQSYHVSSGGAMAAAEKMNVLYIGIDNPINVAVAGYTPDKISVSVSDGVITGSKGHYVARVPKPGKVDMKISIQTEQDGSRLIGMAQFRAKRLPTPQAKFVGRSGGKIAAAVLRSQGELFAFIEDLDFEAHFKIHRFSLTTIDKAGKRKKLEAEGGTLTPSMRTALQQAVTGTIVIFDNITATGPDDVQRMIDPIVFTVE